LSEAITAGQAGHVAAHNDIHDVVNEAARTNVANTFTSSQTLSGNGGKTTLALTDTTANVGLTIGADTNLYRSAANMLKTDDSFFIGNRIQILTNWGLHIWGTDDSSGFSKPAVYLGVEAGGAAGKPGLILGVGDGSTNYDTHLYRNAANVLKTDDEFVIGINGGKDTLALTDTNADVGITIGGDTNLYRSAANELATDDIVRFNAAGTFQTTVGAAGGGSALPATPTKYLKIKDDSGTLFVVPCYAAS
jgi:hypothetical protein